MPGKTLDPEAVRSFLSLENGARACRCHLYARQGSEFNPQKEKDQGWINIVKLEEGDVPFLNNYYEWLNFQITRRKHTSLKMIPKVNGSSSANPPG
ncbi:hypothetical protein L0222_18020, partial [bacterium]|nr:hypothetical protein [bacterium]